MLFLPRRFFQSFLILFIIIKSLVVSLLLSYPVDVRRVDLVPGCHVLLHARRHARLFAAGERAAGLGDALFEAVLLEFLFIVKKRNNLVSFSSYCLKFV